MFKIIYFLQQTMPVQIQTPNQGLGSQQPTNQGLGNQPPSNQALGNQPPTNQGLGGPQAMQGHPISIQYMHPQNPVILPPGANVQHFAQQQVL